MHKFINKYIGVKTCRVLYNYSGGYRERQRHRERGKDGKRERGEERERGEGSEERSDRDGGRVYSLRASLV